MLKVKRAGLGFPALFFYAVVLLVTPNNCSCPAGHGAVASSPAQRGTIVHAGGWTAGGGPPDPEAPRTIVRYPDPDKPDPDPIHRGVTCLKPNNSPDYAPIQPRSPRSRCDSNNSSVIVHTPCASKYASFWVLRYFALSSLGLYGWLWLLSCVSGLCLGIPVVLPVFLLLSYCQSSHVAHEPYLPVAPLPLIAVLQPV